MGERKKTARRGRGEGGCRYDEGRGLWVASVSLGYHAASNFSITGEDSADEGDEPEGAVPYLANTLVITNSIAEGRT